MKKTKKPKKASKLEKKGKLLRESLQDHLECTLNQDGFIKPLTETRTCLITLSPHVPQHTHHTRL